MLQPITSQAVINPGGAFALTASQSAVWTGLAKAEALVFDLDGTLIDTHGSYEQAIRELVEQHTGSQPEPGEIEALEAQGGFNDTWDKALAMISRRGKAIDRSALVAQGQKIYFALGREAEKLLIDRQDLKKLASRYKLFIFSGRTRSEFNHTWARELEPFFERAYCRDDIGGFRPKPHPDYLWHIACAYNLGHCVYIGNTIDDMQCAGAAGFHRVAVTSTHPGKLLADAGAEVLLPAVTELCPLLFASDLRL